MGMSGLPTFHTLAASASESFLRTFEQDDGTLVPFHDTGNKTNSSTETYHSRHLLRSMNNSSHSIVPSNTPVNSPEKILDHVVLNSSISFTEPRVLFKEIGPESSVSIDDRHVNHSLEPKLKFSPLSPSVDSSFKGSTNYTHKPNLHSQTNYDTAHTSFENEILDVTFRNNPCGEFPLKSPTRIEHYLGDYPAFIADTLLNFRKHARDMENGKIEIDPNETDVFFSSSPISKLHLRYDQKPLGDYFPLELDPPKGPQENDLKGINRPEGEKENSIENDIASNCSILESGLTPRSTSSTPSPPRVKRILEFGLSSNSNNGFQIAQRQSDIRFRELSRINYSEDNKIQDENSELAREQRRAFREAQRNKQFEANSSPIQTPDPENDDPSYVPESVKSATPSRKKLSSHLNRPRKKGPIISRSKNGCWTCRIRKKKCTEERPACTQCSNLGLSCDGYSDEKPDFVRDTTLQKEKLNEIKAITSLRKKIAKKSRK